MKAEILKHSIVNRADPEAPFRYQSWPTMCQDEQGRLYAVSSLRLRHIDPFGAIYLYVSEDGGNHWSAGRKILDTPYDDRDPGIAYLGNGRLLLTFYYHTAGLYVENADRQWLHWQTSDRISDSLRVETLERMQDGTVGCSYVCFSEDYGKTWQGADADGVVRNVKNVLTSVPVFAPHGISPVIRTVERTDGVMIEKGSLLYVGRECYSGLPGIPVFVGTSDGKVWKQISSLNIGDLPKYWEAHGIQLTSGRLLAAFRVPGESSALAFTTYSCYSDDGGLTWTKARKVADGAPPHLLQLANGDVVLSYSYRNYSEEPTGIRAKISRDGGKSWSEAIRLTDQPQVKPYDDLGYPVTVELSDHTLLTVYYQHVETDPYPSILCTKWNLDGGSAV